MNLHTYLVKLTLTLIILASLWVGWLIKDILIIFFIAFILAAAIKPLANKLVEVLRVPLSMGILLIYLFMLTIFAFFVALVIPPLITEIIQLIKVLTGWLGIGELRFDWLFQFNNSNQNLLTQLREYEEIFVRYGHTATSLLVLIQSTITGVILGFTVLVISYYLIISYSSLITLIALLFPKSTPSRKAEAEKVMLRLTNKLGGWVRGRIFVMSLIGLFTYIALLILGVPYALALALVAATLEIIPHFGPIIASIPAILVATFLVNPLTGIIVMVFYTILQQVESSIITPQVMKHAVDLQPITTIFLVITGLHVMGVAGGILSLPLYISAKVLYKSLAPHYVKWLQGV